MVHGGYGVGQRNLEGRMLLEFCLEKELRVSNTWFMWVENMNVTFKIGENEAEIDLVLKKEHQRFMQSVKVISGEFWHALVVADIGRKKIRNVV